MCATCVHQFNGASGAIRQPQVAHIPVKRPSVKTGGRGFFTTYHVTPLNDLIEHVETGTDCPCIPRTEPIYDGLIPVGQLVIHNALDGRNA